MYNFYVFSKKNFKMKTSKSIKKEDKSKILINRFLPLERYYFLFSL